MRNNETRSDEVESQLTTLEVTATAKIKSWVNGIFKVNVILTEAKSEDDTQREESLVGTVNTIENENEKWKTYPRRNVTVIAFSVHIRFLIFSVCVTREHMTLVFTPST